MAQVIVPASALRVFCAIAMDADMHGAFFGIDGAGRLSGPHFRRADVGVHEQIETVQEAWAELVQSARALPVWVLNAAEQTAYFEERMVVLDAEIVAGLLAPILHPYWCRWSTKSAYARPLVESAHTLLNCSMTQREPLIVEVSP